MGQGALLSSTNAWNVTNDPPGGVHAARKTAVVGAKCDAAAHRRPPTVRSAVRVACGRNSSSSYVPLRFLCRRPRRSLARGFEARQHRTGGGEVFPGSNGWGPGAVAGRSRGRASSDRPIVARWDWWHGGSVPPWRASQHLVPAVFRAWCLFRPSHGVRPPTSGEAPSRSVESPSELGMESTTPAMSSAQSPAIPGLRWQRLGSPRTPRRGDGPRAGRRSPAPSGAPATLRAPHPLLEVGREPTPSSRRHPSASRRLSGKSGTTLARAGARPPTRPSACRRCTSRAPTSPRSRTS